MSCPICGLHDTTPFLLKDGYTIARCNQCGFLFVDPPPSAEALSAFYQHDEYYAGSSLGYGDYMADRQRHEALARDRLQQIERRAPSRGDILDVGCAAGFFLLEAQQRGWQSWGVELSRTMASQASHLLQRPVAASVDELGLQAGSLGAVTMWEFIEHVADPRAEIERAYALLKPGGVLALSTPNTGYWTAVHEPQRWREFKPPAHLGFFTDATLRRLLRGAGFGEIDVRHIVTRAPRQPYGLHRLLGALRKGFGSNAQRTTPFWWLFGIAWRCVERGSQFYFLARWPGSDLHIGLEAYAVKA